MERMTEICNLCPFNCELAPNAVGKCKVRANVNGMISLLTYGHVTTMIEGPIEQKPLYHFFPGMKVLSIGSSGCNMFCGYCQNFEISQVGDAKHEVVDSSDVIAKAKELGCEGIAFTYSEPLVWFEYVMNVAVNAKKSGLKTILKTNGWINEDKFKEIAPWIDAINIDIKGPTSLYKDIVGIQLEEDPNDWLIMRNLRTAARTCHTEVSTIVMPPYCDNPQGYARVFNAISKAAGKIPIHLLRFIPDFKLKLSPAPTMEQLQSIARLANTYFADVYIDYAGIPAVSLCYDCGEPLVERDGIQVIKNNLIRGKKCPHCLMPNNFEG